MTLREVLTNAEQGGYAIGHFNFATEEQLRAIAEAAALLKAPVMAGTSEGEQKHLGIKVAVAMANAMAEETGAVLFLNADHHKSFEAVKEAVDAGYPSVHFDGSELSFAKNVEVTKQCVGYARSKNLEISVEGELGYLGGGSQVSEEIVTVLAEQMTDPVEAKEYCEKTGVDRLAIAIGNVHGIHAKEPNLDFERLSAIRRAVPEHVVLVLHAGSGISAEDIKKAISLGIANIHISTELRAVFRKELEETLKEHPEEVAPYKWYPEAVEEMRKLVEEKIRLFGSDNKI
ncbi:class II fructose-bisphosphate aldolase [Candidatus Azambacteria bacterium]|nr:class II fructose-bisphosphate aldolase [Candidatus Azambacteria bacterium]